MESVLEQDFTDYEIIVINDSGCPIDYGSYTTLPNAKFITTNRAGLCFACNTGIAIAEGQYIKILHDDDFLLPGALTSLITAAQQSQSEWVFGSAQIIDENGAKVYDLDSTSASGNIMAELLMGASTHMSYVLFDRKTFVEIGGFDPLMKTYEDRDLCWRFGVRQDFLGIKDVVACVRTSVAPGSAYRELAVKTDLFQKYNRRVREEILDCAEAQPRILASAHRDALLRGRVCRQGVFSAALNLRTRPLIALSRLLWVLRVMNWHVIEPRFWKGMLRGS